jgi:hypothetical protein
MNGNELLLRLAASAVRHWTRLYTVGASPALRARRLAEIESDLWEFQRDAIRRRGIGPALQVLARLVAGVGDDLSWRIEEIEFAASGSLRLSVAVTTTTAVVVLLMWMIPTLGVRWGGGQQVAACAAETAPAESTAELRLQVISCAGAFFAPPSTSGARGRR